MRGERARGATAEHKQRAREGRTRGWGHRARAERTSNIFCMFVTLDVSKVSGWLNADP